MNGFPWLVATVLIVGTLAGCGSAPPLQPESAPEPTKAPPAAAPALPPDDAAPLPPAIQQVKSRWVPVRWADLPGFADDPLHEAWNAWLKSCERPGPVFAPLCAEVRRLSIAGDAEQRTWMQQRLQPYRVEPLAGAVP